MKLNLFYKLTIVFVAVVICTSILIYTTATSVIEEVFIDSFTRSENSSMDLAVHNFNNFHTNNIELVYDYYDNPYLINFLSTSKPLNAEDLFLAYYNLNKISLKNQGTIYIQGSYENSYLKNNEGFINVNMITDYIDIEISEDSKNTLSYNYINEPHINFNGIVLANGIKHMYRHENVGIFYMFFSADTVYSLFSDHIEQNSAMYLINNQGFIVSSNNKLLEGMQNLDLLEKAHMYLAGTEHYLLTDYDGDNIISIAREIPGTDMYLINQVSTQDALEYLSGVRETVILYIFIITLVGIAVVFYITKHFSQPLMAIVKIINNVKTDSLEKIPEIKGVWEVMDLQNAYNTMVDQVDEYTKNILEAEKQKRMLELTALQMQIKPHFLYNTLSIIKYLVWQNEDEKATKTIECLIDLLENTVSEQDEIITLEQEIANLKNYLYITNMKYGDNVVTKFYYHNSLLCYTVPKLILQPLIENAYFHAFQNKKNGSIRIIIDTDDENLLFQIIDNGDGIEDFNGASLKDEFNGVGVVNVDQRIKLMYGEEYGVKVKSNSNIGTKIQIKLPISKKNTNDII